MPATKLSPSGPTPPSGFKVSAAGLTSIPQPEQAGGGWRLKPKTGRTGTAIGLVVMALFWNGISWFMTIMMLREVKGFMAVFFLLFLGIFLLIGLFLAWAAISSVRKALFSPVIELTLDAPQLVRGRAATLRWEVTKHAERLRDLHLSLALVEECEYRRGTDTSTDRKTVLELPLADHDVPAAAGTCAVSVPAELPPGFATKANQLVWILQVRGAVLGAPAVDDDFPLRVEAGDSPTAGIMATPLPPGTPLPEDGPVLALAEGAAPGHPHAGIVRAPGKQVSLRLRWSVTGKGDGDSGEVANTLLPADCAGFIVILPASPPSFAGTLLTIAWTLEAVVDGQIIGTHRFPAATTAIPAT